MPFTKTAFPGLIIFEPTVFPDSRGYFYECYNKRLWETAGVDIDFIQDNQAGSEYGVIRGLHFQSGEHAQTKLLRVLSGSILDAVVDLRRSSPTFGKSFSIELSGENHKQLLVPKGFAHGYAVLSPKANVMYKVDAYYNKASEGGVLYNDPAHKIDWTIPAGSESVSDKDLILPDLKTAMAETPFE